MKPIWEGEKEMVVVAWGGVGFERVMLYWFLSEFHLTVSHLSASSHNPVITALSPVTQLCSLFVRHQSIDFDLPEKPPKGERPWFLGNLIINICHLGFIVYPVFPGACQRSVGPPAQPVLHLSSSSLCRPSTPSSVNAAAAVVVSVTDPQPLGQLCSFLPTAAEQISRDFTDGEETICFSRSHIWREQLTRRP